MGAMGTNPPELFTVDEVAAIVRCSAEAVRRAIRRGDLAASKPAGRLLITPAAVDDWLSASRVTSAQCDRSPAPRRQGTWARSQTGETIDELLTRYRPSK